MPVLMCALGMIRTCDRWIRSPLLYPAELRGRATQGYKPEVERITKMRLQLATDGIKICFRKKSSDEITDICRIWSR